MAAGRRAAGKATGVVSMRRAMVGDSREARTGAVVRGERKRFELVRADEVEGVIDGLCEGAGLDFGYAGILEQMSKPWRPCKAARFGSREEYLDAQRRCLWAVALSSTGCPWSDIEAVTGVMYGDLERRCRNKAFQKAMHAAREVRRRYMSERALDSAFELSTVGEEIPVVNAKGDIVANRYTKPVQAIRLVMEVAGEVGRREGDVVVGKGSGNVFNIVLPERKSVEEFAKERGVRVDDAAEVPSAAVAGVKRVDFSEGGVE